MTDLDVTTAHRSAREVLSWSRAGLDPALRAAVDRLPDSMRVIAGYHLGWWDEHGHPAGADPGKALRPALALLTAQAVGGSATEALPGAVAVELVHNFSLLHDDVMDGDATRRHRPTAWTVFGVNGAILAGDSLLTLALDVLAGSGHPAATQAIRVLSAATQRLNDGQAADLAFEERGDVQVAECVRMAQNKTAGLIGASCALGALFGGGTADQVEHLRQFGEHVGLAFQFADDLLGIWGDPEVTGKPVYSDLHNRKKSLPVVAALNSDTTAARELDELYHTEGQLTGAELEHVARLIEASGARDWSVGRAETLLAQAREHLRAADPAEQAERELDALAALATQRDH
ncbi:family 2 encapsulin nanocompartment cargo protein polyprenyl transferase [Actinosynnema sp. NPDC047251]|uniref:Polyprenyl synthetase n=1 Tax=Saccharothrix espanaensis (strain ATCC 51144 / DSM 44229 / JCM 9112 / NBRC 15066 / NRRL 15764) TaxID=1179773 RepID=K0K9M9_SACES|nr:family 2 encapsulin nanocompartment cargo protein polyprenyl transferase [Saccharothrix espanaensis]CCH33333.1 Polyprenyl synthetase [Saccharothrix espanaensis DSM 44229]